MKNQNILNQNQLKGNQPFFLKIGTSVTQNNNNKLINFTDIINARKSENKTVQLNDHPNFLKQNNTATTVNTMSEKKSNTKTLELINKSSTENNQKDVNKTSKVNDQVVKTNMTESNQPSKLVTVLKDPLNVTISTIQDLIQNSGAEVYILKDQQFQNVTDYFKQLKDTIINTNDLKQYLNQKAITGTQKNLVQAKNEVQGNISQNKTKDSLTAESEDQSVLISLNSETNPQKVNLNHIQSEQPQTNKKLSDNVLVQLIINEVNMPVNQVKDNVKPVINTKANINQTQSNTNEIKEGSSLINQHQNNNLNSVSESKIKRLKPESLLYNDVKGTTETTTNQNNKTQSLNTPDVVQAQIQTIINPQMLSNKPVVSLKAVDQEKNNILHSYFKKTEVASEPKLNIISESKSEIIQKTEVQPKINQKQDNITVIPNVKDNNTVIDQREPNKPISFNTKANHNIQTKTQAIKQSHDNKMNTQQNTVVKTEPVTIETSKIQKDLSNQTVNNDSKQSKNKSETPVTEIKLNQEALISKVPEEKQAKVPSDFTQKINNQANNEISQPRDLNLSNKTDKRKETLPHSLNRSEKNEQVMAQQSKVDSKSILKDQDLQAGVSANKAPVLYPSDHNTQKVTRTIVESKVLNEQNKENSISSTLFQKQTPMTLESQNKADDKVITTQKSETVVVSSSEPNGKVIAKFSQTHTPAQTTNNQKINYKATQKDIEQINNMNEQVQVKFTHRQDKKEPVTLEMPQMNQNADYQKARISENAPLKPSVNFFSEVRIQAQSTENKTNLRNNTDTTRFNKTLSDLNVKPMTKESSTQQTIQQTQAIDKQKSPKSEVNVLLQNKEPMNTKEIKSAPNDHKVVQEKISDQTQSKTNQDNSFIKAKAGEVKAETNLKQEINVESPKKNNNQMTLEQKSESITENSFQRVLQANEPMLKGSPSVQKFNDSYDKQFKTINSESIKPHPKSMDIETSVHTKITPSAMDKTLNNTQKQENPVNISLKTDMKTPVNDVKMFTKTEDKTPVSDVNNLKIPQSKEKTEDVKLSISAVKRDDVPVKINRIVVKNNPFAEMTKATEISSDLEKKVNLTELKPVYVKAEQTSSMNQGILNQPKTEQVKANNNLNVNIENTRPTGYNRPLQQDKTHDVQLVQNKQQSTVKQEIKNDNVRINIDRTPKPKDNLISENIKVESPVVNHNTNQTIQVKKENIEIQSYQRIDKLQEKSKDTKEILIEPIKISSNNNIKENNTKLSNAPVAELKKETISKQETINVSIPKHEEKSDFSNGNQIHGSLEKKIFKTAEPESMQIISRILNHDNKFEATVSHIKAERRDNPERVIVSKPMKESKIDVQTPRIMTNENNQMKETITTSHQTERVPKVSEISISKTQSVEPEIKVASNSQSNSEVKKQMLDPQPTKTEYSEIKSKDQEISKPNITNIVSEKSAQVSSDSQVKISSQNSDQSYIYENKSTYHQPASMAQGVLNNTSNRQINQQLNDMKRYEDMNQVDQNPVKQNQNDSQVSMLKQHIEEKQPFIVKFMGGDGQEKIQSFILEHEKSTQSLDNKEKTKVSETKDFVNTAKRVSTNSSLQENTQSNDQSYQGNQPFNFFNQAANVTFNRSTFTEKAKANTQEFLLKINDTISQLKNNSKSNFASFEVEVDQVGNVKTSVEKKGEEIIVRFIAESNQSAMSLKEQLSHLENQLKEFGFMNVNIEYHFDHQDESQYSKGQQGKTRKSNININSNESIVETIDNSTQIRDLGYNSMEYTI